MLNAGMTMDGVAMNTECSTRAFRHLRQHFQATGRTEDRPRSHDAWPRPLYSEHPTAQCFQTVTATAANTHGTHNNRLSAQSVRNRLREGGLSAYMSSICWLCFGATSPRKSCLLGTYTPMLA